MDNIKKFEDFLDRMQGLLDNAKKQGHILVRVEDLEKTFPELREEESKEKPNGGIVMEDFNDGNGFYKVNLAYLNKEQVEEVEDLVKKWNPELKESEDEKTMKRIIALVNAHGQGMYKDDMLAWLENIPYTIDHEKREGFYLGYKAGLEKQGEQKSIIEMKTPEESLGIDSETYNKIVDECIYGEQASAWSEKDREMIDETLYFIREYQQSNRCKDENGMQNSVTCEKWLKSLKERIGGEQ